MGNSFFSTLDMQKGYCQVPMSKSSIENLHFLVRKGISNFLESLLVCVEEHAHFEKLLKLCYTNKMVESVTFILMDDIIVFGKTLPEHNLRLLSAGVKLSKRKYHFGQSWVKSWDV